MKASELAERLMLTPDAEVSLRTNGFVGVNLEYEIEALAQPVKGHEVQILLKPVR